MVQHISWWRGLAFLAMQRANPFDPSKGVIQVELKLISKAVDPDDNEEDVHDSPPTKETIWERLYEALVLYVLLTSAHLIHVI